jgi:nucleotide-binding universal stress UspA family protein
LEKKILIAVDASRHSENALRYAAHIAQQVPEAAFELLHVQATVSQYLLDEAKTKATARAQLEKLHQRSRDAALTMLDAYKSQLISLGIDSGRVNAVTLPRRFGVAKDILEYSAAMRYDAILMGRRGLSGLSELFAGSVSTDLVTNAEVTPVWLVDGKAASHDVMIAVDGSGSAMRAVDHMAFILENSPNTRITFYHVPPRLQDFCPVDFNDVASESLEEIIQQSDQACIDRFFAHARRTLKQAGISDDQITVTTDKGTLRVGKSILAAFQKGGFGTLVIGRRGMNRQFFAGSVSRYLINNLSGGTLWVVP